MFKCSVVHFWRLTPAARRPFLVKHEHRAIRAQPVVNVMLQVNGSIEPSPLVTFNE